MTAVLLWVLLSGMAPSLEAQGAERIDESVRRVLGHDKYKFCHDRAYPLMEEERAWCSLLGETSPRCPALAEACQTGATYAGSGGPPFESRKRAESGTERRASEVYLWSLPMVGGLAKVLLWILLALGLGALIFVIARNFWRSREDAVDKEDVPAAESLPRASPSRSVLETDVERLLARARAAATRGDFGPALDDAYAALLRRLEGDGLIRMHASCTNGDYVRDLAARPALPALPVLRDELRDISRQIERVHFGAETPSASLFEAFFARVLPLARHAVITLVALACVFSGVSCRKVSRGIWEETPSGTRAVMEVLRAAGLEPRHRLLSLTKLSDEEVIVLLPGVNVGKEEWTALLGWVAQGGFLVVAAPDLELPKAVRVHRIDGKTLVSQPLRISDEESFEARTVLVPSKKRLEVENPEETYVLISDNAGLYAVSTDSPRDPDPDDPEGEESGTLVVLADEYLMTNAALTVGDNALFLVELFRRLGTKIDFADDTTGMAPATPMAAVARGKLAPLLSQLALFLLVFYAFKGAPFGAPRDPFVRARRAFADHVRALGTQYGKARAARHVLALYGAYALERLRERVPLGARRGLIPVAEAVARKSGRKVPEVMRLLVEAQSAREPFLGRERPSAAATAEYLGTVRDLSRLMREIGGQR